MGLKVSPTPNFFYFLKRRSKITTIAHTYLKHTHTYTHTGLNDFSYKNKANDKSLSIQ